MGGLPLPGLLGLGPPLVAHPRAHLWLQTGEGCPMLGAHPSPCLCQCHCSEAA